MVLRDCSGVTVRKIPTSGWWAGNTTLVTFDDVHVPKQSATGRVLLGKGTGSEEASTDSALPEGLPAALTVANPQGSFVWRIRRRKC